MPMSFLVMYLLLIEIAFANAYFAFDNFEIKDSADVGVIGIGVVTGISIDLGQGLGYGMS